MTAQLPPALWLAGSFPPDTTVAFRGTFHLARAGEIQLRLAGAHVFVAWLNGAYLAEGPWRYAPGHPEYETIRTDLPAGRHVVAVLVRREGLDTRLIQGATIPPFLLVDLLPPGEHTPIEWKTSVLPGYLPSGQRLNPQLGWLEWTDTRFNPPDWQYPSFDDSSWTAPAPVPEIADWPWQPVQAAPVQRREIRGHEIGRGTFSGPIEHQVLPRWQTDDDLPWYARRLDVAAGTGTWRRFDLGQIMLGRSEFTLDVPAGTVIEIAHAEAVHEGRVTPFIPLSCGLSRNLDHVVARGGPQTFSPLVAKGGRYVEVHIGAPPADVVFLAEKFWQRTYQSVPTGEFFRGPRALSLDVFSRQPTQRLRKNSVPRLDRNSGRHLAAHLRAAD